MVLTGETEVLGEKHYTAWVVDGWMGMEQWWNDISRWTDQFSGMIPIVDNRIPDKRQYLSIILFSTNTDIYWPGIEPDSSSLWSQQPHHVSSSRRIATSRKHVTFGAVGHFMSATPNLPILSTSYGTHHFQEHAPSQTHVQMPYKAPHRRSILCSVTSYLHKGSSPLTFAQILAI
jgi:hypothetical protein